MYRLQMNCPDCCKFRQIASLIPAGPCLHASSSDMLELLLLDQSLLVGVATFSFAAADAARNALFL